MPLYWFLELYRIMQQAIFRRSKILEKAFIFSEPLLYDIYPDEWRQALDIINPAAVDLQKR